MRLLHSEVHREFLSTTHLNCLHLNPENIPYPSLELEPVLDYEPICQHKYLSHDSRCVYSDLTTVDSCPRIPSPTLGLARPFATPPPRNTVTHRTVSKNIPPTSLSIPEVSFFSEEETQLPFSTSISESISESRTSVAKVPLTLI